MNLLACLDEMVKLGTVSDAEAQKAIDRLESLEKSKPTAGQVGRYGALGAQPCSRFHSGRTKATTFARKA